MALRSVILGLLVLLAAPIAGSCLSLGGLRLPKALQLPHLGGLNSELPAVSHPVILVGQESSRDELSHLAASLAPSSVLHISNTLAEGGVEGARELLQNASGSTVVTVSGSDLSRPGLLKLISRQPLTVHVAVPPERLCGTDPMREACEASTRFTVIAGNDLGSSACQLKSLVGFARQKHPSKEEVELAMGENTFFLSLTFPNLQPHLSLLPELLHGTDAVELRVDLLESVDPYSVLEQLQLLRMYTNNLPIIFTIRSKGQCGAFRNDPRAIFSLLQWGLRGGAEYLDIEANWPMRYRRAIIRQSRRLYPAATLMGSYHVVGRRSTFQEAQQLFRRCYHRGLVDAVKVVTTALETADSYSVHEAAKSLSLPVPYIGLSLGVKGQLSRVLNNRFTPVTHPLLPVAAAPGQLSAKTIMKLRQELGVTPKQTFHLFGSPIAASPSPAMHNAAFKECGLPHHYELCESEGEEKMAEALCDPNFGGASVTIPHKQNVMKYLDELSDAAQAIGAVNTVIVCRDPRTDKRILRGDNTDWLGIMRPIRQCLLEHGRMQEKGMVALIVGGGGAAMGAMYAMKQLGMKLVVYNRTAEKAVALASRFGGSAVASLDAESMVKVCGRAHPDVVISTIPGQSEFSLPPHMVSSNVLLKPVVFEAAYKPPMTELLRQAIDRDCPYVQGAEMLIEQGIEQFQRWTKRAAPRQVMADAVYSTVEKL
jgi:pentafunctional AROM polypeptide